MAAHPPTKLFLEKPGRRSFLLSFASFGLTAKIPKADKRSEPVYRFLTPACEVSMSVQYFASSRSKSLRFRDDLTNRNFCLSQSGGEDAACVERFVGSMAIAHYNFHSRLHSGTPLNLRERVLTIDHDSRISPRAPFERVLSIERALVSDIQAFGYNPDNVEQARRNAELLEVWYLVRQDLYLNDQATAFLIVHWKHTLNFISLLDVIPGAGTELIRD